MFKFRYLPQYILAFLLLLLIFFILWTWYLGTASVTFERLIGERPSAQIEDLSLRRYKKSPISPHLFTIGTHNPEAVIEKLQHACGMEEIPFERLSGELEKIDPEMVEVIEKSPWIYQSVHYNLKRPKEGRLCVLFRDKSHLYLFVNGNLEELKW